MNSLPKKPASRLPFTVYSDRLRRGFSLIELLIVISLFALVAVIVTVSYIGYESREEVKNAALQMVTDIRGVQNKAKTGDKVANSAAPAGCRTPTDTLLGWYIKLDLTDPDTSDEYVLGGVCLDNGVEKLFASKTVALPKGVVIESLDYNGTISVAHALFKTTELDVTFHNDSATDPSVQFSEASSLLSGEHDLIVTVNSTDGGSWEIKITPLGNVETKKI